MKRELNYNFIPVPQKLYKVLDNNCKIVMTVLIELDSVFADANGWFFRSISDLIEETKLSKNLLNAVLVTLNRNNLIEVKKPNRNVNTNSYRINFNEISRYNSISFEDLKKIEIKTINYKDPSFKVSFTEVHSVNTYKDNSSHSEQGEVHSVNNRSSHSEHNIIYNIKDSNNNNNRSNNINNIYYSVHTVNNGEVNCFLTKEEIEEYNNSVNSENNLDNSNKVNSKEVEGNNNRDNSNIDNSNEENTAVLSPSNSLFEELVISTEKSSENGLKQAKTRELEIINKTDNSNSVEYSTANAVTEETVYSNIDNSKEVEGNNNRDNFNYVNSDNRTDNSNLKNNNTANAVTEEVDNLNSVKPVIEEGIEGENKTDNSNEGINSTIAFGDNSTANAVSEFRDKCINYTIILEGKKIEIDRTIDEFVREYYSEIMNNILTTKEFEKQRKIFNRMIVDNNLNDTKYNEMCDKLDVRYSRYVELDNQLDKSKKEKEFTQEEAKYIANELLNQCLNFTLTKDNRMQDFYSLRNEYNAFIEEYNIPKEGLKLQKKFAELSNINKKLNTPVSSQSFAV